MLNHQFSRSRVFLGFFFLNTVLSIGQTVRPIDEKGLDSLISHRNGKHLVLNIWATWCIPCKEEFPDLIKLSDSLKAKQVEVVAISVDYPDEINSKIQPFLKKMKPPFRVFVWDFPSQDAFFAQFDKSWSGAIPATFIYDNKGIQQRFLLGKQSNSQFKKAIDDVLRKQ